MDEAELERVVLVVASVVVAGSAAAAYVGVVRVVPTFVAVAIGGALVSAFLAGRWSVDRETVRSPRRS